MSLFDSMSLPKWQHKSPEARKQAVNELDDQVLLLELVNADPDLEVQAAALARIKEPKILDELIESLPPPLQTQARAQRLQQLMSEPGSLASIADDTTLMRIANLSDQIEVINSAIDRLSNEQARADVACQHTLAKARLHAAQGIHNLDVLDQLMHRTRGHDKAVFRHCKNLVDEAHARARQEAERQEKIDHLSARMAELAGSVDSPSYESHYRSLVQQWQGVESSATAGQKAAFQSNQAICGQRLILRAEVRAEAELSQTQIAAAREEFPAITHLLAELDTNPPPQDKESIQQLGGLLDALEARWRAAEQISAAPAASSKAFEQSLQIWRAMLSAVRSLLARDARLVAMVRATAEVDIKDYSDLQRQIAAHEKFLASAPWPVSRKAQMPEPMLRLQQSLKTLKDHTATLDKEQEKITARLEALTTSLAAELEQQHHKEAARAIGQARKFLKSLEPGRRQHFEQVLAPHAARLKEFHDWQNFAIEPKKEDLCARMSALIGGAEDIDLLALNIQSLQSEWKQLGPLPQAREKALWTKFKAAADEAWKPCKAAFTLEAELRRKNYAQRMELVAQLTEYETKMAWPQTSGEAASGESSAATPGPDWNKVQSTLDTARAAFRASGPVDQKAERVSQKAFRTICDRIYGHIRAEYQRNITRKESLVARARALAEQPELHNVVDAVKKLQGEWKATGITPIGPDRKLWKEFRTACDAVFVRLDQQREKQKSEANAQVQQAESLRDQARALLQTSDPSSGTPIHKSISELKSALMAIDLPPPIQQRLIKDFQGMERQARDLAATLRKREVGATWIRLADAIRACAAADSEARSGAVPWESSGEMPKGVNTVLLQTFWTLGPAEGNDEACRDACIALEVFGEIESPPEDKGARMNYQLRRLTQKLGHRVEEPGQALLDHVNAFTALRPESPWVERFYANVKLIRN